MTRQPSRTMVLVAMASAAACAGGRSEDRAAARQRRTTQPVAETSRAARVHGELTTAVERLSSGATTDREVKRQALVALADALESVAVSDTVGATTVRGLAAKLGRLPATSLEAVGLLHEAFTSVLATLAASTSPASTTVEFRRALSALASAVEALGDGKGLTDHSDEVVAFRAATNAVFLLGDHPAPFQQAGRKAERSGNLQSYEAELAEVRRDVVELARTSWSSAHIAAARALTSLADVVELVEPCGPSPDAATVRFEARRMLWARGAGVIQSRSIESGLSVVLDVLERVETAGSSPATKAARVAVDNVNLYGSLAFQQAVVQDAFRATIDVFNTLPAPSTRSCVRATGENSEQRREP